MSDTPATLRAVERSLQRYVATFLPATKQVNAFSEEGIARSVLCAICVALSGAAEELERLNQ